MQTKYFEIQFVLFDEIEIENKDTLVIMKCTGRFSQNKIFLLNHFKIDPVICSFHLVSLQLPQVTRSFKCWCPDQKVVGSNLSLLAS